MKFPWWKQCKKWKRKQRWQKIEREEMYYKDKKRHMKKKAEISGTITANFVPVHSHCSIENQYIHAKVIF